MTHATDRHRTTIAATALAAALLAGACGAGGTGTEGGADASPTGTAPAEPVIDPGDGGNYAPELDPADFVDGVTNPYMPLVPGSRWVYEGEDDGETEHVEVVVTDERKEVLGISAVVVRDTVEVDGELAEDTFDWFAQDRDGNVWYLGEDTTEYEDGEAVNHDGAWEAGVDGAFPGIVMPADPTVGHAYRQEYYEGEAEDLGEILDTGASVTVPAGAYRDVVVTRDWNPLEPDVVEEKYYAPGIGVVLETKVEGGTGRIELLSTTAG
jgi:hypothetical protein